MGGARRFDEPSMGCRCDGLAQPNLLAQRNVRFVFGSLQKQPQSPTGARRSQDGGVGGRGCLHFSFFRGLRPAATMPCCAKPRRALRLRTVRQHRLFRQARLVLSAHSAVPVCWALFGPAARVKEPSSPGILAADAGPTAVAKRCTAGNPPAQSGPRVRRARALHRRDSVAIVTHPSAALILTCYRPSSGIWQGSICPHPRKCSHSAGTNEAAFETSAR